MHVTPQTERAPRSLGEFVDALQASGRYVFERGEALRALGTSEIAVRHALRRLAAKGRVVAPRRGFFVIVPLEYRSAGAPPPSWYIDQLMKRYGHPYYVGVLTAAALHGAAHQQPQEFQVVTDLLHRPAAVGRSRLRFLLRRHIERAPTVEVKTETGTMRVSTPEATALDLVRYVESARGLGNVVTVLAELAEHLDAERLAKAAQADIELSVVQRSGFLLDQVGAGRVTEPLARWVSDQRPRQVLLHPGTRPSRGAKRDARWGVVVNVEVEADE